MRYCTRCVYPENHPLNLTFDEEGVCSGCRIHEEKDRLDWNERLDRLKSLLDGYRNRSGKSYDCIIPVSGARDSYFIVHTIKNELNMRPLLVSYNKQYNTRRGIRNLAYLRTLFDTDILTQTISPAAAKRITRATLKRLGSMYWHCIAGETVFPVQVAVRFKIPLIIWGAHQGIDQVGMYSHLDEVEMTRRYRKDHDLMGLEAEDLVFEQLVDEQDVRALLYPHDKELEVVGVRGIYLNNYIRWDTKAQHERMIRQFGYESAAQDRTFDTYSDVDSIHYSGIHDYIKLLKHGYGKVSDHATRELRLRRLTREEAIDQVAKYQDNEPRDVDAFLDWIDMDRESLISILEKHRSDDLWERDETGKWKLKDSVLGHRDDDGVDRIRLDLKDTCYFVVTPSKMPTADETESVLMERGFVDGWEGNPVAHTATTQT